MAAIGARTTTRYDIIEPAVARMEVKKRRAGKPKSRAGCTTCKARRVKCDEGKPECRRCQKLGTECGYTRILPYATSSRQPFQDLVPLQPRLPLLCIHRPSASIPCDERESRYFQLFHEKLAIDLCGHFETPFWTRLIPQECHQEPAIRHAVFALSALCKSAASKTHDTKTNNEHLNFALVQHSKAIRSLRRTLSDGRSQVRLALIASLLLGCFESFHGNWETAAQQIHSGLNILKSLQEDRTGKVSQSPATIDPELGLAFQRLKLQILSFLAMSPTSEHPFTNLEDEETMEDLPDQFATLNEALQIGARVGTCTLQYLRRSARYRDVAGSWCSLVRRLDSLNRTLEQWHKAYQPIFLKACENVASREYIGALQLRTCIWVFEIMLATSMTREEIVFDIFTERFQHIVFFSRHILEKDQEIRRSDGLRVQYGMGLIMTLFYTATRCRDFSVRREAIAILRQWPCMNGIWDSLQAIKIAEWIMSIEEKGCDNDRFIPEECRVRMNSLKVTSRVDGITVECVQGPVDNVLKVRKVDLLRPW